MKAKDLVGKYFLTYINSGVEVIADFSLVFTSLDAAKAHAKTTTFRDFHSICIGKKVKEFNLDNDKFTEFMSNITKNKITFDEKALNFVGAVDLNSKFYSTKDSFEHALQEIVSSVSYEVAEYLNWRDDED